MNIQTLTEEYASHPLSETIQARQAAGAGNCHTIVRDIAVRTCPASELPPGLRDARQKVDEKDAEKALADRELTARLAAWEHYQSGLVEIADRRKHLDFASERLALAKDAVSQLQTNFAAIQRIGHPETWAGAIEMVRDAVLCEKLVELLPVWIGRETREVEKLEGEAARLERQYGE